MEDKTKNGKEPKFFKVPASVLAAARQVIGQMPYDQVGKLCVAIDTQCEPLE